MEKKKIKPELHHVDEAVAVTVVDPRALQCPKCLHPLRPPVFQCAAGHVVCAPCHGELPDKAKCASCFVKTGYGRCFVPTKYTRCLALERILGSLRVACPNARNGGGSCSASSMPYHEKAEHEQTCAPGLPPSSVVKMHMGPCKHGCDAKITYHQQQGHEDSCPERPGMCRCPVSGCGFFAQTEELFDHLTAAGIHRLPWDDIKYFVSFNHEVKPGIRLLRGDNKLLFLLEVARAAPDPSSLGHVVSLTFARPNGSESTVGCSVFLCCGFHHYQVSKSPSKKKKNQVSKFNIGPDVASKQILCAVSDVSDGKYCVDVSVMIDMASGDGHELGDYQEWDDDGDTTEEEEDDD